MNTPYYVAGFDKSGRRVVTILCEYDPTNPSSEKMLQADKEKAVKMASDASVIEVIDQDTFGMYMNNCIRDMVTGKPILYVAPEPTAEERKASAAASVAAIYNPQLAELKDNLVTAVLTGDTALQEEIKKEYAELVAEYNAKLEGLDNG
ncbi:MAG: hypothetical protein SOR58_03130 [Megasphaera massiliensis]|uniref:hypothetical protein n=1 Tax=Megasphaera massiliensis TaxID=1232428 RepID=UPI002A74EB95|nr:hypothetical protein [Megasphaera massiliensis]MDY2965175.1 hypothetical protein [Megasphaera massiliensis]